MTISGKAIYPLRKEKAQEEKIILASLFPFLLPGVKKRCLGMKLLSPSPEKKSLMLGWQSRNLEGSAVCNDFIDNVPGLPVI